MTVFFHLEHGTIIFLSACPAFPLPGRMFGPFSSLLPNLSLVTSLYVYRQKNAPNFTSEWFTCPPSFLAFSKSQNLSQLQQRHNRERRPLCGSWKQWARGEEPQGHHAKEGLLGEPVGRIRFGSACTTTMMAVACESPNTSSRLICDSCRKNFSNKKK